MRAESSLLYPNHESDNNGLRSPEETQRTINFLLAELTKALERIDGLNERVSDLEEEADMERASKRDLEQRFELMVALVCSRPVGRLH